MNKEIKVKFQRKYEVKKVEFQGRMKSFGGVPRYVIYMSSYHFRYNFVSRTIQMVKFVFY
jgi:hypothetical protein